jgi:hypothetical protein
MVGKSCETKTKKDMNKSVEPNKATVRAIVEGRKLSRNMSSKRYSSVEELRKALDD